MWTALITSISIGMAYPGPDDQADPAVEIDAPAQHDCSVAPFGYPKGSCEAGTKIKDLQSPGGYASSDNWPRDIDFEHELKADSIHLLLDADVEGEPKGYRVRLINTSGQVVPFHAVDGRLSIVQQALNADGEWRNVEMLPSSGCGNSYHRVMLDRHQYWQFDVPLYDGSDLTQIRYMLVIRGRAGIISNAIEGRVNTTSLLPFPIYPQSPDPVRHMPASQFIEASKQD
tara:strand:- start:14420 stop:15106 length:687 start_codon:yes stop_codon:yes gene_type:complete